MSASLFPYGWSHYLQGGLLIGSGVALLFVLTGMIGGSGVRIFSSRHSLGAGRGVLSTPQGSSWARRSGSSSRTRRRA